MDRIDKKILEILQVEGRISNQELADRVALSPSPCGCRTARTGRRSPSLSGNT